MDIFEMLSGLTGDEKVLKELTQSVKAEPKKVEKAVQLGIPMLMEALNRNAKTPQGAQSLAKALEQHQDDKIDDLTGFFRKVDTQDGSKMLKHIFSNQNQAVQQNLSQKTGLKQDQVGSLLSTLAPLLMGAMGNQKKAQNLDAGSISNLTSSLTQNLQKLGGGDIFSMATQLLDSGKDQAKSGGMDFLQIFKSLTGDQKVLQQLTQSVDAEPKKVEKAVQLGIPMLMEALNRNAKTPQGAQSLAKALEQHQDDKIDDLTGFFRKVDTQDGSKMLKHIFANQNQAVQQNLSQTTGLKPSQTGSLLSNLAPLVLGLLGNQKKAQNLDANGISNLTSLLSQNMKQMDGGSLFSLATKLLDTNKSGSIFDEILGFLFKRK